MSVLDRPKCPDCGVPYIAAAGPTKVILVPAARLAEVARDIPRWGVLTWEGYGWRIVIDRGSPAVGVRVQFLPYEAPAVRTESAGDVELDNPEEREGLRCPRCLCAPAAAARCTRMR